jgi:hypothetical protein
MKNQPKYKRGNYKPRTKPPSHKGTFREGSIMWFSHVKGMTNKVARDAAKEYRERKGK